MEAASPFAQMPPTPEPIIARVRTELERLAAQLPEPSGTDPARLADETVRRLWDSHVKVFIPVLALREGRDRLLAGAGSASATNSATDDLPPTEPGHPTTSGAISPMRDAAPWGGAIGLTVMGWPVGEALVGRPWLGVGLAGWVGIYTAMWVEARHRR